MTPATTGNQGVVTPTAQCADAMGRAASAEQFVRSLAASMEMEGLSLSAGELAELGELAAGRIDFAEYRRRVGV